MYIKSQDKTKRLNFGRSFKPRRLAASLINGLGLPLAAILASIECTNTIVSSIIEDSDTSIFKILSKTSTAPLPANVVTLFFPTERNNTATKTCYCKCAIRQSYAHGIKLNTVSREGRVREILPRTFTL